MKKKEIIKTCLSVDCPERFSLCCGAVCTHDLRGNKPEFMCSKCKKEWQAGECTA